MDPMARTAPTARMDPTVRMDPMARTVPGNQRKKWPPSQKRDQRNLFTVTILPASA
jgi:hypothetical protein